MQGQESVTHAFEFLNSVGTVGLAFIVWALLSRRLITRGEFDREVTRCENLERRLDKALDYGDRALGAGEKLLQKHE
jgi:hypothetical protein